MPVMALIINLHYILQVTCWCLFWQWL